MNFISGLKNCHVPGVNSYVMKDRVSPSIGMLRVFHCTSDSVSSLTKSDGSFRVAPHNHRQDIALYAIKGVAYNVNFRWQYREHGEFCQWKFSSAIVDDSMRATIDTCGTLAVEDITPIPETGLFIPAHQVHTVIAPAGSAWFVMEGQLAPPAHVSYCYSRGGKLQLQSDDTYDLYQPMTAIELRDAFDAVLGVHYA